MYLIPDGYRGWAAVEYEATGAPPLPEKDGSQIIEIPASGYLKTSSRPDGRFGFDRCYYVQGKRRQEIPRGLDAVSASDHYQRTIPANAVAVWGGGMSAESEDGAFPSRYEQGRVKENTAIYEVLYVGTQKQYLSAMKADGMGHPGIYHFRSRQRR